MTNLELSDKWIKASVAGTIWAASEIVFGSFLHNLRIPFCGNILTAIGVIVLISIAHLWKDRGIFWRAGLICALMKTMSPSAVIFGPMIAIFVEAILLEISIFFLGRTYIGFLLGSILAMSWNLVQKILSYILFYGFDIIEIYAGLVKIAEKQINYHFDLLWTPVFILLFAYIIFGVLAGITGIRVGKKIIAKSGQEQKFNSAKELFITEPYKIKYSLVWFLFNIIAMIGGLILLKITLWFVWIPYVLALSIAWVFRYRRALKKISNPKFWIIFVVITALTVFVFSDVKSGNDYLKAGIITGVEMNIRAVLIILGFSVLAVELYNPVIREFFKKSSFRQLPVALELSFESLPAFVSAIPDFKTAIKQPVQVFYSVVLNAENRLKQIKAQSNNHIYIITGTINDGKTSFAMSLFSLLCERNLYCGGIFSEKIFIKNKLIGYEVVDPIGNKRMQFLEVDDCNDCNKIGKFKLVDKGFDFGKKVLRKSFDVNQIIFIDECGKLELSGNGWFDFLKEIESLKSKTFVLTIRDINVDDFINNFGWENITLVNVLDSNPADIANQIIQRFKV